jgi:hypothetical protein
MSIKETPKSPYKNYSIEDIMKAEAGHYCIQVGGDFFSYHGKIGFSRQRAEMFYDDLLNGLNDMKKHGSDEEKGDAYKTLLMFKILPLRVH